MLHKPDLKTIRLAKELGSDNIELHTGKYCRFFRERKNLSIKKEFLKINESTENLKLSLSKSLEAKASEAKFLNESMKYRPMVYPIQVI